MIGLGTIINTAAIVVGGVLGLFFGKFLKERFRTSLMAACGVCVLFIGLGGALEKMLTVSDGELVAKHSALICVCVILGTFLGELLNIEHGFERFGGWLKKKTNSENDTGFVNGFLTASLTVSIGAMAIIGAIKDGIYGDWSVLASKGMLDLILIMIMTCSLGKGCIFSAIPVLVLEGLMTLLAVVIKPIMTDLALDYVSLVGSILIFCVGLNLLREKQIRVANMLPAIVLAVIAALLPL